jgi:hypothetical protein
MSLFKRLAESAAPQADSLHEICTGIAPGYPGSGQAPYPGDDRGIQYTLEDLATATEREWQTRLRVNKKHWGPLSGLFNRRLKAIREAALAAQAFADERDKGELV